MFRVENLVISPKLKSIIMNSFSLTRRQIMTCTLPGSVMLISVIMALSPLLKTYPDLAVSITYDLTLAIGAKVYSGVQSFKSNAGLGSDFYSILKKAPWRYWEIRASPPFLPPKSLQFITPCFPGNAA